MKNVKNVFIVLFLIAGLAGLVWLLINYLSRYWHYQTFLPVNENRIIISAEKNAYQNNGLVFEPINFTVTNKSGKSIYYLHGCAVQLPEIEKQQENQFRSLLEEIICDTMPLTNQLKPNQSFSLTWDQKINSQLVENGVYRLRFKYLSEETYSSIPPAPEKWKTVFSSPFTIDVIEQTQETTANFCQQFNQGFKINGGRYENNWCQLILEEFYQNEKIDESRCYYYYLSAFAENKKATSPSETSIALLLTATNRPKSCQYQIQYQLNQTDSSFAVGLGIATEAPNCKLSFGGAGPQIPFAQFSLGYLATGKYLINIENCQKVEQFELEVKEDQLVLKAIEANYGKISPKDNGIYIFPAKPSP